MDTWTQFLGLLGPLPNALSCLAMLSSGVWTACGTPVQLKLLAGCKMLCVLQVMKQLPVFRKLVQEAAEGNDESEDIAKGLARVFAEVGEAYVSLISAGRRLPHEVPPFCYSEQYAS